MRKYRLLLIFALSLSLLLWSNTFAYASTDTLKLTLDDAVKRAFNVSTMLKNNNTELKKKEYLEERASSLVRYTPIDYSFNPGDKNVLSSHMQAQFAVRSQEKKIEADKRQLVIDVKNAYYAVIKAKKAVEVCELAYQKAQIIYMQNQAKYKVGMATDADLFAAEAQVTSDKAALVESRNDLDNKYAELNKLIGVDIKDKPELIDKIPYTEATLDPVAKASLAAEISYESWSASEAARIAEKVKIFEQYWDIGEYTIDQAKNTELDTKNIIKKQTRALCLGVETLKEKHGQLETKNKELNEKLRVAKTQYALGLLTKDVVQSLEKGVKETEAALMEVDSSLDITVATVLKLTGELATP